MDFLADCATNVADQFWAQTRNGLTLGSIYAMIALGYTMVYGVLQLINFAHSEVFMVSTVAALYAIPAFGVTDGDPATGIAVIFILIGVLLCCMAASGALAVLLERLAYRPLRKRHAPRLSFLISAIGASLFIQYLFVLMDGQHYLFPIRGIADPLGTPLLIIGGFLAVVAIGLLVTGTRRGEEGWVDAGTLAGLGAIATLILGAILVIKLPDILGPTPQSVPELFSTSTVFTLFGAPISNKRIMVVVVTVVMLVILDAFVRRTRMGRGIRAVAQDSEAASLMGVNINRVVVVTFLVGGLMAGAAGLLYQIVLGAPAFWFIGFKPGIKAFVAAVLGGIGNIRGAMLGGLLLGLVEAYAVPCIGTQWIDVTAFVVLVAVLMFRPTGILGEQVGA
ncbi:MAG: branched-chain amino acid ABC transporter permease [Actinobacteria bacterium]|nr:branched-chain amino acid ABC transporter permease [Actinomycetota bacterium]